MYCVGNGIGDGSSNLYRVDSYDTAPTAVNLGEAGLIFTDIAVTPSGAGYAITANALYEIDLSTGAAALIGPLGVSGQNSLVAASDKRLFSWGYNDSTIYSIDPATGSATPLVDSGFTGADLAMLPGDCNLYGATMSGRLIKINLSSLDVTDVGSFGLTELLAGLSRSADGRLWGTHGNNSNGQARVYEINLSTGAATLVGNINGVLTLGNYGMAIAP